MLRLEQLKSKITALGAHAVEKRQRRALEVEELLTWLESGPEAASLRQRLQEEEEETTAYAEPVEDGPLNRRVAVTGAPARQSVLVAVDGSQIMPDRHAPVLYYLLQMGGLLFTYDGEAPRSQTAASLHYEDAELYDQEGQVITHQLGMRRAVAELSFLARLVAEVEQEAPRPILALTDGPLLWPYSGRSQEEIDALLPAYFAALSRMREQGGMPIGFVERPGGRPLVDLLRLTHPDPERTTEPQRLLLTDQVLMARFLEPGQRSPWFRRNSPLNQRHQRYGHPIWFCYLHVGEPGYPVIARVEVPEWAARQGEWVESMQRVLVHQSCVLGGHPYALARAHELALVTLQDRQALDALLQRRLLEAGVVVHPSEKARQKSYLGRR
ncbi:MAG: DNA double-strand break repair nuclease NurA [Anaerolineales bacterium]